jgi:hypothetical protein
MNMLSNSKTTLKCHLDTRLPLETARTASSTESGEQLETSSTKREQSYFDDFFAELALAFLSSSSAIPIFDMVKV